jgi:hypothetical protein
MTRSKSIWAVFIIVLAGLAAIVIVVFSGREGTTTTPSNSPNRKADVLPQPARVEGVPPATVSRDEIRTRGSPFLPVNSYVEALVVGTDGATVSGAAVGLLRGDLAGTTLIERATTDGSGVVRFDVEGRDRGTLMLSALRPVVSPKVVAVINSRVVLRCRNSSALRVRILSEQEPQAGIVTCYRFEQNGNSSLEDRESVTVDAPGKLQALPGVDLRLLGIAHKSVSEWYRVSDASLASGSIDIQIEGGAKSTIRVQSADGARIGGARVLIDGVMLCDESTDARGELLVGSVPPTVQSRLGLDVSGLLVRPQRCSMDGDVIVLVAPEIAADVGKVSLLVTSSSGTPIPDAIVGWDGDVGIGSLDTQTTGADGVVRRALPDAKFRVRPLVYCEGFLAQPVAVSEDENRAILDNCAGVAVAVVGEDGTPRASALVIAEHRIDRQTYRVRTICDSTGVCRLFLGSAWSLFAVETGGTQRGETVELADGVRAITLKTKTSPPRKLSVRVSGVDESSETVRLVVDGDSGMHREVQCNGTYEEMGNWGRSVTVTARTSDCSRFGATSGDVGEPIVIELSPAWTVQIAARTDAGPSEFDEIMIRSEQSSEWSVPPTANPESGSYRVCLPSAGPWGIRVSKGVLVGEVRGVLARQGEDAPVIDVLMSPNGRLAISLPPNTYQSRAGISCHLRQNSEPLLGEAPWNGIWEVAQIVGDGRIEAKDLAGGIYNVLMHGATTDGRRWIAAVSDVGVKPGEATEVSAWFQYFRPVLLDGLPLDVISRLVIEPAGRQDWIGRSSLLRVRLQLEVAAVDLWPGQFLARDLVNNEMYTIDVDGTTNRATLTPYK